MSRALMPRKDLNEFDLVINCDFITDSLGGAEIVAQAFKEKFAAELAGKPFVDGKAA